MDPEPHDPANSQAINVTETVDATIVELSIDSSAPLRMLVKPKVDACISATIAQLGWWEPYNTALLKCVLREGDCFIDLGANLGYFSVVAADCVGKTGRVMAFEPEPESFRFCQLNVQLNQFQDVVSLHQLAVGEGEEAQTLFRSRENHGAHQLVHNFRDGYDQHGISVNVTSLDRFAQAATDFGPIHVIKMDVQGYETKVLLGMRQLIDRNRDWLMVLSEFSPTLLQNFDNDERGLGRFYRFLEEEVEAIFMVNKIQPSFKDVGVIPLTVSELRTEAGHLVEASGIRGIDVCADLLLFFSGAAVDRFVQRAGSSDDRSQSG